MSNVLSEKYLCFIMFHFSRTLQFDLMLENELFAFTLFLMEINDSVLDQISFRTLCSNELWSKTEALCKLSLSYVLIINKHLQLHLYIY